MGYAARIEKLFLKLWSGAYYCGVAQVHWVAGNKKESKRNNGLSQMFKSVAESFSNKCNIRLGR